MRRRLTETEARHPGPATGEDRPGPKDPVAVELVDVAVPMARSFAEEDARRPEGVALRRREAAERLLRYGFTREDAALLYGDVSLPGDGIGGASRGEAGKRT